MVYSKMQDGISILDNKYSSPEIKKIRLYCWDKENQLIGKIQYLFMIS